ncbi:MAG TPA: Holliday junction branch migration protein RuvA [Candidatus Saccharimonadales bacterium]|nr:Holliday junction branch migration protein RuvA [Candidatus Saccharimonadales bacterium]
MIASVRGRIVGRGTDHVVVETGGVGYRIFVPRHPDEGEVLLHTHQVVREDAQLLFGFETQDELALFELLIGVSGVGPKAALALLGISRPVDVAAAIAAGDAAALAKAPGVGKKTAERLIVDLRAKVGSLGLSPLASGTAPAGGGPDLDEAQAALRSLGYTPAEAATALAGVPGPGRASTEERLAAALRSRDPR